MEDSPWRSGSAWIHAAAQGQQEATSAITAAQSFGYGSGTPLYFDLESSNTSNSSCSQAVLAFLGGWTQGLHAAGYLSGVYSSAATGIRDLVGQYGTTYPSPDAIWIAHWNTHPVLTDTYVPAADWANHQRVRQYGGSHKETWGGDTIDIDSDISDGPAAGSAAGASPSDTAVLADPDETTVAPGQTTAIQVTLRSNGSTTSGALAGRRPGRPVRHARAGDRFRRARKQLVGLVDRIGVKLARGRPGRRKRPVLQPVRLDQPGRGRGRQHPVLHTRRTVPGSAWR